MHTRNVGSGADGLPHELEILAHQPEGPDIPLCILLFSLAADIINEAVQKTPHDARDYRRKHDCDYLIHGSSFLSVTEQQPSDELKWQRYEPKGKTK